MMRFLLLAPILLYFLAAIAILVIRRLRSGMGYAWLMSVVAALAGWGLILFFRFNAPPAVILLNWLPVSNALGTLIFQLDTVAWVYSFSLVGITTAVILTASARLKYNSNPSTWAASLAISAAGMTAMLAGTPLALVLSWTLIDMIELIFMLGAVRESELSRQVVVAFSARVTGTLVLMGTMMFSKAGGQELLLIAPLPELSIFLLIAAGLRLGVLPLHLPYLRDFPFRRGVSTVLRVTAAASSLVVLGRLPKTAVSPDWFPWLLLLAGLAAFYGAVMWLISENEIKGRPYWMIALAGLAMASVIRGYAEASLAWGVALILSGGLLFLYSTRDRRLLFLPALGALGLAGLPFTPAATGWLGLVTLPFNLVDLLFVIALVMLLLGYIHHFLRPGDALSAMERWIQTVYPLGLLFPTLTAWLVSYLGWSGSFGLERWWASLTAGIVMVGSWFALRKIQPWWDAHPERTGWISAIGRPVARVLNRFLRLDWFYALAGWLYRLAQRLVQFLTVIFEGEGGLLWVFVLLALVFSLLQTLSVGSP